MSLFNKLPEQEAKEDSKPRATSTASVKDGVLSINIPWSEVEAKSYPSTTGKSLILCVDAASIVQDNAIIGKISGGRGPLVLCFMRS